MISDVISKLFGETFGYDAFEFTNCQNNYVMPRDDIDVFKFRLYPVELTCQNI